MRKLTILLICAMTVQLMAQEDKLRISLKEGSPLELGASNIKDITFVNDTVPLDIVGEWFCEADSLGTYESLDLHEDGTIKWFYIYTNYQSGGTLLGTYSFEDYVLKLKFPSMTLIKLAVVDHSNTQFTSFYTGIRGNYYKVQKVYYMTTKDDFISIGNEGDVIIYVDKQFIGLENNKIKPLKAGTGYALVKDAQLNTVVAYKVIVGSSNIQVTDWTKCFKKSINEILNRFGEPNEIRVDDNLQITAYVYNEYSPAIKTLTFSFDNTTEKAINVSINLRTESYFDAYHNYIKGKYVFKESDSTPTEWVYYDTDDRFTASVMITLLYNPSNNHLTVIYTDLNRQ